MTEPPLEHRGSGHDLKGTTARGVLKSAIGQLTNILLRTGSMIVMARLVNPEQFGLVGMVTAVVGILALFRDAGLPMATVQRASLSEALLSTLFWANLAIGVGLAALTVVSAPALASFYGEPRLVEITCVLALNFVFNGAAAQHRALLQRRMRFGLLATIEVLSWIASIAVGIPMALAGLGYWSLVGMALAQPFVSAAAVWLTCRWIPGRPQRVEGLQSMLSFGAFATLNSTLAYVAYNVDKVLVGRFLGAEVLGVYGRAYQLVTLPSDNLNAALGSALFPALSRLQDDPARQRNYFLRGYATFLAVILPISLACGLYAEDFVRVLLGRQWGAAAPIFRLLAPTIVGFGMMNPMLHLLYATGQTQRSVRISLLIAPVVICGYALGLAHGAAGVAIGFSAGLCVLILPVVAWSRRGTLITGTDLVRAVLPAALATLAGGAVSYAASGAFAGLRPVLRLVATSGILMLVHFAVLLALPSQRRLFGEVLRALRGRRQAPA